MFNSVKIIRSAVVAMATVGVLLVAGCTGDLEKRISKVEDEVRTLKALTETLSSKMEANLLVKSVTAVGTGWDIVFSDDSKVEVRNEGADGITPKLKVAANGEDGYSLWYNVTAGYPESGWVNTGQNIQGPAGPGGGPGGGSGTFNMRVSGGMFQYTTDGTTWTDLVAVPKGSLAVVSVDDNENGTVTFVTEAGEFTFAVAQTPITSIEVIATDDAKLMTASAPVAAVKLRVSPSNAKLDVSKLSFDDVDVSFPTRATGDYRTPSEHFAVEKLEQEADGVYFVYVKAIGSATGPHDVALVYEVSTSPLVLISTSMFDLTYKAGELVPPTDTDALNMKALAEDDGFDKTVTINFKESAEWKVTVEPLTAIEGSNKWMELSKYGAAAQDAGTPTAASFNVILEKNTGAPRSATITVTTEEAGGDANGHSEFSFVVNQATAFEVLTEGGLDDKLVDALKAADAVKAILTANNGNLSKSAAAEVTELDLNGAELTDLTGLDTFFTGLEKLSLSDNDDLEVADLSGFKKMTDLVIEDSGIETLILPVPEEGEEALTILTVTGNEGLTQLSVSEAAATKLTEARLYNNGLTSITLPSKAEVLETLDLSGNGLTTITLPTEADALDELDVSNNKLKGIDVSNLPTTMTLGITNNPGDRKPDPTRAALKPTTHEFIVVVGKDFKPAAIPDGYPSGDELKWDYDPDDTVDDDEYGVEATYKPLAKNYATSVVISTLINTTLGGEPGNRTLTVNTSSGPITFVGTVNATADDKDVTFGLVGGSEVAELVGGNQVKFNGGVGQVVLTATADGADGEGEPVTDKVTITVEPAVAVGTFTLAAFKDEEFKNAVNPANIYALGAEQTVYLKPTLNPDPTLKTIAWEIDDPETNSAEDLFSINPTTGVVTIKAGAEAGDTATATAKIEHGKGYGKDATATITFTVAAFTAVETLTVEAYDGAGDTATKIDDADLGELVVDGQERTIHLRAVIAPEGASIQNVVWSKEEGGDDTIEIDPETGIVTIDTDATYEESATFKATIVGGGDDGEDISDEITLTMEANE